MKENYDLIIVGGGAAGLFAAALAAVKENIAQLLFENADPAAQRRLGDEKGFRRRGDTALADGFEKSLDFLLCHFFCSEILNLVYIINQKTALCKETFLCYSKGR